jgi:hypothetical protein
MPQTIFPVIEYFSWEDSSEDLLFHFPLAWENGIASRMIGWYQCSAQQVYCFSDLKVPPVQVRPYSMSSACPSNTVGLLCASPGCTKSKFCHNLVALLLTSLGCINICRDLIGLLLTSLGCINSCCDVIALLPTSLGCIKIYCNIVALLLVFLGFIKLSST